MSINNVRAVGDDRPWKDEVERELKQVWDALKYGKISLRATGPTSGGGGGGGGADLSGISATLPATYDIVTYTVGVDQDTFDHISNLDYAQFDTTTASAGAVGRLMWNDTDGTLEFGLKGGLVTLQIGQEQVMRVRNATAGTLVEGTVCYFNGSDGTNFNVEPALATSDPTSAQTMGVLTETLNTSSTQHGFLTTFGLVRNIDLSYISGLTAGDQLYLDGTTAGRMTRTKPSAPTHLVYVGICLSAAGGGSNSTIFVKIQNGYELNEIHDVKITGPVANNEVLAYTSADSLWENKTASEAGLIASGSAAGGDLTGTYPNPTIKADVVLTNPKIARDNSADEGGQLNFARASDNATYWYMDSFGSTSTPAIRFIAGTDNRFQINANGSIQFGSGTGSSGQVLTSAGSGGSPTWTTISGTGTVTNVATGTGLTGGPITTTGTISLANTAVTTGSYGSASAVGTFTVDQQGRLTAAGSTNIAIDASAVTSGTLGVARGGTGATSFTSGSYLKGNGSSAISVQTGIPAADLTGQVAIANGGTNAATAPNARLNLSATTVYSQSTQPAGADIHDGDIWVDTSTEIDSASFELPSGNMLINGGFDFWQRGTSFSADGYCADRWYFDETGTCTVTQVQTPIPTGTTTYALQAVATTVSDSADIYQCLERYDVFTLRGKTVTFSCYILMDANMIAQSGAFELKAYYSNVDDARTSQTTLIGSETLTKSNYSSYARATYTFTVPADAYGLRVAIEPPLTVSPTSATYYVTQAMLEVGSFATDFKRAGSTYTEEQNACYRYYQRHTTIRGTCDNYNVWKVFGNPIGELLRTTPTSVIVGSASTPAAGGTLWTNTAMTISNKDMYYTSAGSASNGQWINFDDVKVECEL